MCVISFIPAGMAAWATLSHHGLFRFEERRKCTELSCSTPSPVCVYFFKRGQHVGTRWASCGNDGFRSTRVSQLLWLLHLPHDAPIPYHDIL